MGNSLRWPLLAVVVGLCAAYAMWGHRPSELQPDAGQKSSDTVKSSDNPLLAVAPENGGKPAADPAAMHGATKLKIAPDILEFGEVPVNETHEIDLQISNPEAYAIKMSQIRGSCGCIKIDKTDLEIAPGKSEKLNVKITALPGRKREVLGVYFYTDESKLVANEKPFPCRIELRIAVKEEIVVEPNTLFFDRVDKGQPKSMETIVSSTDKKPFLIKTVACANPAFAFKWDALEGGASYKVTATFKGEKGGVVGESASVVTDRVKNGTSPLVLKGMVNMDLKCQPSTVISQGDDARKVAPFSTVMKRTTPGRLEILGVEESAKPPANMALTYIVDRLDESSCRLTITFTNPYPMRAPYGKFSIKTNVDETPFDLQFRVNGLGLPNNPGVINP